MAKVRGIGPKKKKKKQFLSWFKRENKTKRRGFCFFPGSEWKEREEELWVFFWIVKGRESFGLEKAKSLCCCRFPFTSRTLSWPYKVVILYFCKWGFWMHFMNERWLLKWSLWYVLIWNAICMNFTSALLFVLKQVTWPSYYERGLFILISKNAFMLPPFPSHVIETMGSIHTCTPWLEDDQGRMISICLGSTVVSVFGGDI